MQGQIRGRARAVRRARTGGSEAGQGMTTTKPGERARETPAATPQAPWERVVSTLVYAALLVYSTYPYSDFDWGWHYRYGEYFFTHGRVLRHDIFSWTMAGYEWVNHSWLFDPLLYLLYTRFSFIGLSIAGALASVLTFYLCVHRAHLAYWQTAVLAVFFYKLTWDIMLQGLRTQVVGLLLLALLVDLLARERAGRNWPLWVLPGVFCLWANLHGSFLLGLVVFGAYLAWDPVIAQVRGRKLPRRWYLFAGSFLASIAATLANPFTYGVYLEAQRHFGNPHLAYVVEWMPPNFSEFLGMVFLAYTLVVAYGFFVRKTLADVPDILIALGTLYLGATVRRHVAVFVVLTLPIAASAIIRFPAQLDAYVLPVWPRLFRRRDGVSPATAASRPRVQLLRLGRVHHRQRDTDEGLYRRPDAPLGARRLPADGGLQGDLRSQRHGRISATPLRLDPRTAGVGLRPESGCGHITDHRRQGIGSVDRHLSG